MYTTNRIIKYGYTIAMQIYTRLTYVSALVLPWYHVLNHWHYLLLHTIFQLF